MCLKHTPGGQNKRNTNKIMQSSRIRPQNNHKCRVFCSRTNFSIKKKDKKHTFAMPDSTAARCGVRLLGNTRLLLWWQGRRKQREACVLPSTLQHTRSSCMVLQARMMCVCVCQEVMIQHMSDSRITIKTVNAGTSIVQQTSECN